MTANTSPIFSAAGDIQWNSYATAANTTADLTSGTTYLCFTADATNGGFVTRIRFRATPAGNTTATVARIWINNGSTAGTAANNVLHDEITLPAITASGTAATAGYELPLNFVLPAGYKIYVTIHTASANGWAISVIGGKY
jgi:hypothetical protein